MPAYKFYRIGESGHVASPPIVAECPDDFNAVKEARQLLDGQDIEIWQGVRLVSYLVPDSAKTGKPI